jgi:hypothetical protein
MFGWALFGKFFASPGFGYDKEDQPRLLRSLSCCCDETAATVATSASAAPCGLMHRIVGLTHASLIVSEIV